jgi:hypothetical protein
LIDAGSFIKSRDPEFGGSGSRLGSPTNGLGCDSLESYRRDRLQK